MYVVPAPVIQAVQTQSVKPTIVGIMGLRSTVPDMVSVFPNQVYMSSTSSFGAARRSLWSRYRSSAYALKHVHKLSIKLRKVATAPVQSFEQEKCRLQNVTIRKYQKKCVHCEQSIKNMG